MGTAMRPLLELVFPAWAGVDLTRAYESESLLRIPRVGGGRPMEVNANPDLSTYSPRGRG